MAAFNFEGRGRSGESNDFISIHQTPEKLRKGSEKIIDAFCKTFEIEGKDGLIEELKGDPEGRFIISSSHLSNLDAPAAVRALGDIFNIQISSESLNFGFTPQEAMFRLGGRENFSSLEYRKHKGGKSGVFNPDDFRQLEDKVEEGKTPWMAVHPFTREEEMQSARIGSVYLAQKSGAKIIPAALEVVKGGSISLDGVLELAKAGASRLEVDYHIGKPIELEPIDVSIIEKVLDKRKRGEKPTKEEREEFSSVHKQLRAQAEMVAKVIANMLPNKQRGDYKDAD